MTRNKRSIAELKSELYISELIEKHKTEDFWLVNFEKEQFEKEIKSILAKGNPSRSHLSWIYDLHKEFDILFYLLIAYFKQFENRDLPSDVLTPDSFLCGNIDVVWEQIDPEVLSRFLEKPLQSFYFLSDKIKTVLNRLCKKGKNCYEPCSHFLTHSEQLVASQEEKTIRIFFYLLSPNNKESRVEDIATEEAIGREDLEECWNKIHKSNEKFDFDIAEKELMEYRRCTAETEVVSWIKNEKITISSGEELSANSAEGRYNFVNTKIWEHCQKTYDNIFLSLGVGNSFFDKDVVSLDVFDIKEALNHVTDGGHVILLMDEANAEHLNWSMADIHKRMLDAGCLSGIISDTFMSKERFYIFEKGKKDDLINVRFPIMLNSNNSNYAETSESHLMQIRYRDLVALDFDVKEIRNIPSFHASEGDRFLTLSSLLTASKEERVAEPTIGRIFEKSRCADDWSSFIIEPVSLREAEVDSKWKKITTPTFVIGNKMPLQVAYVKASTEHPVFFRKYDLTFSVKEENIEPRFLYLICTNGQFQSAADFEFIYTADYEYIVDEKGVHHMDFCPSKALLDFSHGLIAIPSISKQRELTLLAEKTEQNRIDRAAMSQYRQDIHERKHALAQIILNMRSSWDALVLAKEENEGVISDNYVYGKKHPHTVKSIFESVESYMDELSKGIETFTPEDNAIFQTKELINVTEYLEEYVKKHSNPYYDFEIVSNPDSSDKGLFVFSRNALDTICQNIVFNAWKHGFRNRTQGNVIRLSWSEDEDSVQLFISNNGSPLEESMNNINLFKYGITTARNQEPVDGHHHYGLGCYQVWCLMRDKGQGDVQCISEPEKEFPVTFKLIFNK